MDSRFVRKYEDELKHLRTVGAEFADENPKIASRLGIDRFEAVECADPFVERLLEGFAFLAARVQLKIDAEFPRFSQNLLQIVYPQLLTPTPSMAVVQLRPILSEGALADGVVVPRASVLRSRLAPSMQTACEFRTSHDVTLWPIELEEASYFKLDVAQIDLPKLPNLEVKAAVRLRLKTREGLTFDKLALDRLSFFLRGSKEDKVPAQLYEQLVAHARAIVVRPGHSPVSWQQVVENGCVRPLGFSENEAILPASARSFEGYRLLREYFALPERFLFVELGPLRSAVRRCTQSTLDVFVLFDHDEEKLERAVNKSHFALFCTPAVNLFPKTADRVQVTDQSESYHLVADRTRPLDYEVFDVTEVTGYGTGNRDGQPFHPFYQCQNGHAASEGGAYFTLRRDPRVASSGQRRQGARFGYLGHEVFVSLVDADEAPYRSDLRQLSVATLCTNRGLPLDLLKPGATEFELLAGLPVEKVVCLVGPTRPSPCCGDGEIVWRLISHMALNYLSLIDNDEKQGAAALRELLLLYSDEDDSHTKNQIDGVRSIQSKPITRRAPIPGPICYARGLEVTLVFDEEKFETTGIARLGSVLAHFFKKYVSVNSFVEVVLRTAQGREVMRCPTVAGLRHIL